ncbi:hypothetical protein XENOCAPTIV_014546, partial [Xenoophorus captivus]
AASRSFIAAETLHTSRSAGKHPSVHPSMKIQFIWIHPSSKPDVCRTMGTPVYFTIQTDVIKSKTAVSLLTPEGDNMKPPGGSQPEDIQQQAVRDSQNID